MTEDTLTTNQVINEVLDLIALRLHRVPLGDPGRDRLAALVPDVRGKALWPAVAARASNPRESGDRCNPVLDDWRERRAAWRGIDREVRKGRILTALGSDSLETGAILARVAKESSNALIFTGDIYLLLKEMRLVGDVECARVPRAPHSDIRKRGGYRLMWRRAVGQLSPELKDLERRLSDDGDGLEEGR